MLRKLGPARALDPCHRPEGSWALGTRMSQKWQSKKVYLLSRACADKSLPCSIDKEQKSVGEFILNTFLVVASNATLYAIFSIVELGRSIKR